jgi:hypothetical protein
MTDAEFNGWVMESPLEKVRVQKQHTEGEVTHNTPLGKYIFDLAQQTHYKNFLEVGTLYGRGTTKCFLDAIMPRSDNARLTSIESNPTFFQITKEYWDKYFHYKKINPAKFNLIFGTMVTYEKLDDNYTTDSGHTKETYDYNADIKSAPLIKIEEEIDVLCLDGGHFSTIHEWNMFKNKIKAIVLDDTKTSKTKNILTEIHSDKTWDVILDSDFRNGQLVAIKQKPVPQRQDGAGNPQPQK